MQKPDSEAAVPAFSGNGPTAPACPQGWCMPWPTQNSHDGSSTAQTAVHAGQRQRGHGQAAGQRERRAAAHRAAQAVARQQAAAPEGADEVGEASWLSMIRP